MPKWLDLDGYSYLVFTKEWEMEDDLKWLSVGGKDNQIGETSVKGLGGLIGTLLQLYHLTNKRSADSNNYPSPAQLGEKGSLIHGCSGHHMHKTIVANHMSSIVSLERKMRDCIGAASRVFLDKLFYFGAFIRSHTISLDQSSQIIERTKDFASLFTG